MLADDNGSFELNVLRFLGIESSSVTHFTLTNDPELIVVNTCNVRQSAHLRKVINLKTVTVRKRFHSSEAFPIKLNKNKLSKSI